MKKNDLLKRHCYETQNVEFKKSLSSLDEGIQSLSAFLNTENGEGVIYFGVSDNGDPVGLNDNIDSCQKTIRRKSNALISPRIIPEIIVNNYEQKTYLQVSVKREDPSLIFSYKNIIYLRCGSENLKLNDENKKNLLRRRYSHDDIYLLKELDKNKEAFAPRHVNYEFLLKGKLIFIIIDKTQNSSGIPMRKYCITNKGKEFCMRWFQ